jgi:acetyl-CoA C-acetyltransferase
MSQREVVVLSAVRSAIGTFGGSLSGIEPPELAGTVMKEAVGRSGVDPKLINYVTVGNTIPTESRYAYVARVASIRPGCRWNRWRWPSTGCVHRACRRS